MKVGYGYNVGWYSLSPSFAWHTRSHRRLEVIKEQQEARRKLVEARESKQKSTEKITEGTISVYAQQAFTKGKIMNCFEIQVRGVSFKVWAPTLQDALETFLIDMDFFEVPAEVVNNDFYMPDNCTSGF